MKKQLCKRLAAAGAATVLTISLAACAGSQQVSVSGTEATAVPAPSETVQAATDAPTELTTVEETAKTVEELIVLYDSGSYHNDLLKKDCTYEMPLLNLTTPDAVSFNTEMTEIYDTCNSQIQEYQTAPYADGVYEVHYTAAVNGQLLSRCVERRLSHSIFKYNVINIDIPSGAKVADDAVLAAAGTSADAVTEKTRSAVDAHYNDRFGEAVERSDYKPLHEKTLSDENIAKTRYYLGEGNSLYGAFTIYYPVMAGESEGTAQIAL